jgi:hypothetical protein
MISNSNPLANASLSVRYFAGSSEPILPYVFQIAGSLGALSLSSDILLESSSVCANSPVACALRADAY